MQTVLKSSMLCLSSKTFNVQKGCYKGFVNLGEDIVSCNEEDDTVATEALIFMLCALRSHWKYPVGYVLIDKIDAETLSSLVWRVLQLSFEHDLNVRCVTCDGTSTNFSTMKMLGCRIGKSLEDIDGTFMFDSHELYFTPDPVHMLKLAT